MRTLNGMDAAFLYGETPTMHFHIVGVLIVDPSTAPDGWHRQRLEDLLGERLHLLAPLRWRLVNVPGGLDRPAWIEDPDFDLHRHVHYVTLGPPGGPAELVQFVSEVASHPLDRRRPLWEIWVVDGLDDGTVAMISKVHHAMMDGAAAGTLMAAMLDLDPVGGPSEAEAPWRPDRPPGTVALMSHAVGHAAVQAITAPAVAVKTARAVGGLARTLLQQPDSHRGVRLPAPWTPVNGPLTAARRVAFGRCAFDDVRRAKSAFGTTVNDVVLAGATSAMRAYLVRRDALPPGPLLASVPVSVRAAGQEFGNHTSTLLVTLPTQLDDPIERLRVIHVQTTAAKSVHRAAGAELIEDLLGLAPHPLVSAAARVFSGLGLARFLPPAVNLIVSNVAGPPFPVYCAGARVLAMYPMGPLIEGTGVNLTVLSQGGDLDVGVMSCPSLVDDAEEIATGFADGLEELATMARCKSRKGA